MSIGENIKRIREDRGLTRLQLCKKVGITEKILKEYEENTRVPKIDRLLRISQKLNTTIDELVSTEPKLSVENVLTLDELYQLRDIVKSKAEDDNLFNSYNYLLDKLDNALKSMKRKYNLHLIRQGARERNIESGNFFLMRREKLHISRNDLARACNVTTNVISDWESGFRVPTKNHIPVLKNWFKLTSDEIETYINPDYRKDQLMEKIEIMTTAQLDSLSSVVDSMMEDK